MRCSSMLKRSIRMLKAELFLRWGARELKASVIDALFGPVKMQRQGQFSLPAG